MVVVAVVVMRMIVMGGRGMRVGAMTMSVVVMLDLVAARVARMRPENGDQAGQDGAQQRQKDNCLNHSIAP